MLESVTLRDFQSHKLSELVFSSGLNVIVGASDKGKTSIIRALEWVRLNRPLGDSFVRRSLQGRPASSAHVTVVMDGHTIERVRGKSGPDYRFDGVAYNVVNRGIPEPVVALLWQDINVQRQLDSHFFVMDPSSQSARMVNEATGLLAVDKILKVIGARAREVAARAKFVREQVGKAEEAIADPRWALLDDYKTTLTELESIVTEGTRLVERKACLETVIALINTHQQAFDSQPAVKEQTVASAEEIVESLRDLGLVSVAKWDEASRILACIEQAEAVVGIVEQPVIDADEMNRLYQEIVGWRDDEKELARTRTALINCSDWAASSEIKASEAREAYNTLWDRLVGELSELIVSEGICPVCNTKLATEESLEQAIVNMCDLLLETGDA